MNKLEYAKEAFNTGSNCAQSVVKAFSKDYFLDFKIADALAAGLGGGLKSGANCGAMLGGVLVIGLANSQIYKDKATADNITIEKTKEFVAWFESENKHLNCRDILGKTPQERVASSAETKAEDRSLCSNIVLKVVEKLIDMGY